ncbi:hypothetical protein TYRP_011120 [Tyrophagus putrescentiae]|nr:hypothetical protein TYRP_011120 [Tyrophagus putrescentiae]
MVPVQNRTAQLISPTFALVKGNLAVLVANVGDCPRVDQVLGNVAVAPEAGVVQGRVAVLVQQVDVRLVLQQQHHHVSVAVSGRQVQRRVVAHVRRIDARPLRDEHLRDLGVAGKDAQWRGEKPWSSLENLHPESVDARSSKCSGAAVKVGD